MSNTSEKERYNDADLAYFKDIVEAKLAEAYKQH